MNRVTLCSNCREKSREIIAYGEKLAAAEARLRSCEEALRVACEALTFYSEFLSATGNRARTTLSEIAKLRGDAGKGGGE